MGTSRHVAVMMLYYYVVFATPGLENLRTN
jgi:hypothetical protein